MAAIRFWILGGLLGTASLALPGCGATRAETRGPAGWSGLLFPWRALAEESETSAEPPDPPAYDPSLRSPEPSSVTGDPEEYYQPRSRQPIVPPPAPPAGDAGYFESEAEPGGSLPPSGTPAATPPPATAEPSRLRDLFDSVRGRRAAPPVQRIPLDGPVAGSGERGDARPVGFDVPEPVTLGDPEFDG